jgi:hypothetical protein
MKRGATREVMNTLLALGLILVLFLIVWVIISKMFPGGA